MFRPQAPHILREAPENFIPAPGSENFNVSPWVKSNITVTVDNAAGPFLNTTADLFDETTGTNTHYNVATSVFVPAGPICLSVYVKNVSLVSGTTWMGIRLASGFWGTFDIASPATANIAGTGTRSGFIDNVGNGYQRYWVSCINTTNVGYFLYFSNNANAQIPLYTGTGAQMLVWGAQIDRGYSPGPYRPRN